MIRSDKPVMRITDAMKGLNPIAFEQAAQELARERGIQLEDPRRPYSALCEWEKGEAKKVALATVNALDAAGASASSNADPGSVTPQTTP